MQSLFKVFSCLIGNFPENGVWFEAPDLTTTSLHVDKVDRNQSKPKSKPRKLRCHVLYYTSEYIMC